jgi:hypothetical protein
MKKLLMFILALVVIAAAVGFVAPTEYELARSVTIDAPPAAVHVYLGDLAKWPEWSPWEANDPSVKTTLGAQTTGVGASQTWTSESGDGELTFTACDPATGVAYDMMFIMEDKRAPASAIMSYKVVDGGTEVTWSMEGDMAEFMPPVFAGLMQLMSGLFIGSDFDQGLAALKTKVEAAS